MGEGGGINTPWSFQQLHVKVSRGRDGHGEPGRSRRLFPGCNLSRRSEDAAERMQGGAELDLVSESDSYPGLPPKIFTAPEKRSFWTKLRRKIFQRFFSPFQWIPALATKFFSAESSKDAVLLSAFPLKTQMLLVAGDVVLGSHS